MMSGGAPLSDIQQRSCDLLQQRQVPLEQLLIESVKEKTSEKEEKERANIQKEKEDRRKKLDEFLEHVKEIRQKKNLEGHQSRSSVWSSIGKRYTGLSQPPATEEHIDWSVAVTQGNIDWSQGTTEQADIHRERDEELQKFLGRRIKRNEDTSVTSRSEPGWVKDVLLQQHLEQYAEIMKTQPPRHTQHQREMEIRGAKLAQKERDHQEIMLLRQQKKMEFLMKDTDIPAMQKLPMDVKPGGNSKEHAIDDLYCLHQTLSAQRGGRDDSHQHHQHRQDLAADDGFVQYECLEQLPPGSQERSSPLPANIEDAFQTTTFKHGDLPHDVSHGMAVHHLEGVGVPACVATESHPFELHRDLTCDRQELLTEGRHSNQVRAPRRHQEDCEDLPPSSTESDYEDSASYGSSSEGADESDNGSDERMEEKEAAEGTDEDADEERDHCPGLVTNHPETFSSSTDEDTSMHGDEAVSQTDSCRGVHHDSTDGEEAGDREPTSCKRDEPDASSLAESAFPSMPLYSSPLHSYQSKLTGPHHITFTVPSLPLPLLLSPWLLPVGTARSTTSHPSVLTLPWPTHSSFNVPSCSDISVCKEGSQHQIRHAPSGSPSENVSVYDNKENVDQNDSFRERGGWQSQEKQKTTSNTDSASIEKTSQTSDGRSTLIGASQTADHLVRKYFSIWDIGGEACVPDMNHNDSAVETRARESEHSDLSRIDTGLQHTCPDKCSSTVTHRVQQPPDLVLSTGSGQGKSCTCSQENGPSRQMSSSREPLAQDNENGLSRQLSSGREPFAQDNENALSRHPSSGREPFTQDSKNGLSRQPSSYREPFTQDSKNGLSRQPSSYREPFTQDSKNGLSRQPSSYREPFAQDSEKGLSRQPSGGRGSFAQDSEKGLSRQPSSGREPFTQNREVPDCWEEEWTEERTFTLDFGGTSDERHVPNGTDLYNSPPCRASTCPRVDELSLSGECREMTAVPAAYSGKPRKYAGPPRHRWKPTRGGPDRNQNITQQAPKENPPKIAVEPYITYSDMLAGSRATVRESGRAGRGLQVVGCTVPSNEMEATGTAVDQQDEIHVVVPSYEKTDLSQGENIVASELPVSQEEQDEMGILKCGSSQKQESVSQTVKDDTENSRKLNPKPPGFAIRMPSEKPFEPSEKPAEEINQHYSEPKPSLEPERASSSRVLPLEDCSNWEAKVQNWPAEGGVARKRSHPARLKTSGNPRQSRRDTAHERIAQTTNRGYDNKKHGDRKQMSQPIGGKHPKPVRDAWYPVQQIPCKPGSAYPKAQSADKESEARVMQTQGGAPHRHIPSWSGETGQRGRTYRGRKQKAGHEPRSVLDRVLSHSHCYMDAEESWDAELAAEDERSPQKLEPHAGDASVTPRRCGGTAVKDCERSDSLAVQCLQDEWEDHPKNLMPPKYAKERSVMNQSHHGDRGYYNDQDYYKDQSYDYSDKRRPAVSKYKHDSGIPDTRFHQNRRYLPRGRRTRGVDCRAGDDTVRTDSNTGQSRMVSSRQSGDSVVTDDWESDQVYDTTPHHRNRSATEDSNVRKSGGVRYRGRRARNYWPGKRCGNT